jgi:transcriptional regulator with XRE-family HTH domain
MSEQEDVAASIGGVVALAAMLRRVRADRAFSQEEVAARIQRPAGFVARLESADVPEPSVLTVALLASACEVSVSLFVASFALPTDDPLPWPREHRPPSRRRRATFPGARALGATLRELRYQRNWSQQELGARAGMSASHIGALERGAIQSPLLLTVARIGRGFATTPTAQVAHTTHLAQAYAGEIKAPPLRHMGRDRIVPPADPD